MKLTNVGKFLRKMRIDTEEFAEDMAIRLGITASYLSSIEVGRRPPTVRIIQKVVAQYRLNGSSVERLWRAFAEDGGEITIKLGEEGKYCVQLLMLISDRAPRVTERVASELMEEINRRAI